MTARLILAEKRGCWAVALRAELADAGIRLWEAGTLQTAWQWLDSHPASFLIVELSERNTAPLVHQLLDTTRDRPRARVAVVAPRRLASCEWLLREAGAIHFVCSPRAVGPLAAMACQHLAAVPEDEPRSLRERIWQSLPWGE